MRILHVPYSFYPDAAGGTEVYVESLASCQRALGYDVAVAAPCGVKDAPGPYDHNGTRVFRFPISARLSLRDLYGEGDAAAALAFGSILDDLAPDIVHLHALTSAVSVRLAEEAVGRGIPIVMNYHTPTVTCARGTLLKWGTEICDGRMDRRACASCVLHGHGMARPLARAIGSLPRVFTGGIGAAGLEGGVWTALRMPELVGTKIDAFHRLTEMADRVIALCNWTRELLIRNGVAESKLALCRQGITWQYEDSPDSHSQHSPRSTPRMAFLGRLDPTKGVHVVVETLRNNPNLKVQLDIFGVSQGDPGNQYASSLRDQIADDPRIRILPPLPSAEVVHRLRDYDVLTVPSQLLETGPLVVLESFAAGTPVVGSNLGGIAELVRNEVDGLLVEPSSHEAWAHAFRRICGEPGLLLSLRQGIRKPRRMRQVAEEFASFYDGLPRTAGKKSSYVPADTAQLRPAGGGIR